MIGRVERQHRLIEELRMRSQPFLPAELLAERLGATTRTVQRDIADLVAAGVPVRTKRGLGGGYGIDTGRTLPPLAFTPGEAAALVVSLATVGPRASATAQSAMAKLLDALCGGQRNGDQLPGNDQRGDGRRTRRCAETRGETWRETWGDGRHG